MKKLLITLTLLFFTIFMVGQEPEIDLKFKDAIPVLNLGTFHMSYTPDANTTEFDEHDKDNVQETHQIAKAIAAFDPTVIIVERLPKNNEQLQKAYMAYVNNPDMNFPKPSEVELLAFEVGRLAGTDRIYGIDYREGYNYRIASQVKNSLDTDTYKRYMKKLDQLTKKYPEEEMTLLEKFKNLNNPRYQDILININADMLTHVSSPGNSEGADEAAKFYHRNLAMYSNLNQIELTGEDRVFILMGGTHTAFFNMWLERSPKYNPADLKKYLNMVSE